MSTYFVTFALTSDILTEQAVETYAGEILREFYATKDKSEYIALVGITKIRERGIDSEQQPESD